MADSVEFSTVETSDGTIGIVRDNAARQSIANIREGKEAVGAVAWENVKDRPTNVSSFQNDKKYQTEEDVANTLNGTLYAGSSTHGGPATSADKLTTARTISLTGAASGSGSFDGSANSTINVSSLDATKLTGVVPITNLPPSVIERMSVVKDDTERFSLTTDSVQDGDVVKVQSSNLMYYVVDDTKLNSEAGYEVFKAGSAASVPWGGVTGKPSTFPPSSHTHTKSQITDFPSSMPNPNNLTMQIEGSDAAVYNGGTAQTFNVTKSALGLDKVNNTADADKSVKYASSAPWIGVTGKPSTFPPSAHTHSMSQITDLGVFGGASATAAGSAGLVPQPAAGDQDKYLSAKGTWESITGKISGTKVTSANSADKLATARNITVGSSSKKFDGSSDVNYSLSEIGALGTSDVHDWAKASSKPSYSWSEITGKPSTFPPSAHNHDSAYLKLSGGTMTGQLLTSFKNSVATGSYQAAATTVPDLIQEVRYSSGCMGSANLTTAYNDIPAAWYNFLYIPHRSGGVSGAAYGDNCNYGTLLLFGMTTANQAWVIEFQSSKILGAFSIRNTDTTYTALKNPNALSITANGTTVTYDGSSAQSITLSSGSSKSIASTLLASGWSGSAAPYTYDLGSTYSNKSVMIGYDGTKYSEDSIAAASDADIVGGEGTVIYAYGEKPTVDIPIIIQYS